MKKNIYISLTFIVGFIALTTNVKALQKTCTYYIASETELLSDSTIPADKIYDVKCVIDTDKKGGLYGSNPNDAIYCTTNYKWPYFNETTNKDGYPNNVTGRYIVSNPQNFFTAAIGDNYADAEDNQIYKDWIALNDECPKYINIIFREEELLRTSYYFANDKQIVLSLWSSGRDCALASCQDNVKAPNLYWGSTNKSELPELIKYQKDINNSDANNGEIPDYALPDDEEYQENHVEMVCGLFGKKTFGYIELVWNVIKYATPILIIILGILDFIKVVFSGEDKDLKEAGRKFLKQIIIGVAIILLPALLGFLLDLVGFSEDCLQYFL